MTTHGSASTPTGRAAAPGGPSREVDGITVAAPEHTGSPGDPFRPWYAAHRVRAPGVAIGAAPPGAAGGLRRP
jgi:hypothetical protein